MIYFPEKYPSGIWNPEEYGLAVEDVYFKTKDGFTLHGWFVPSNEGAATLMWFHGNAGNLSHRLENIKYLHELHINIFIFDYRGYGKSEGDLPSEKTIYMDAGAAYQYIIHEKKIPEKNLIFFGSKDTIVPLKLGRMLFNASPEPKIFYEIKGADHNNTYVVGGEEYFNVINRFIRGLKG